MDNLHTVWIFIFSRLLKQNICPWQRRLITRLMHDKAGAKNHIGKAPANPKMY